MSDNVVKNGFLKEVFKGSIFAVVLSVFFVLFVALIARIFSLNSNIISAINVAIKMLSVFCAVLFFAKIKERGAVKGAVIAVGFVLLSHILFFCLGGHTDIKKCIFDLFLCVITGGIAGIIKVNSNRQ